MANLSQDQLQAIIEAALMAAARPLSLNNLQNLFDGPNRPSKDSLRQALDALKDRYAPLNCGITLEEVASGYRLITKPSLSQWLVRLWEERAPRYSRAFLETLAIIAYKQPITRAEIEEIRGVVVSSQIMKALQERDWIHVLGYRDVPGKPTIYGTTKPFLDYFKLNHLADLPTLTEFTDLMTQDEELQIELALNEGHLATNEA